MAKNYKGKKGKKCTTLKVISPPKKETNKQIAKPKNNVKAKKGKTAKKGTK